jgi:hypothetical protein
MFIHHVEAPAFSRATCKWRITIGRVSTFLTHKKYMNQADCISPALQFGEHLTGAFLQGFEHAAALAGNGFEHRLSSAQ